METGFTLDKESNTMGLICSEVVVVLAFDSRELLIQWQVKVRANLVEEQQFLVQIAHVPSRSKLASGPARLHLLDYMFCLTAGVPPKLLGVWPLKELRRFGVVDGKFCFEGGSRCGKGEGLHVLLTNQAKDLVQAFDMASRGRLPGKRKMSVRKGTGGDSGLRSSSHSKPTTEGKPSELCSSESTKPLLSSSGGSEGVEATADDSHLGRSCHIHHRWPSCIVPCGSIAARETDEQASATEDAHRTVVRPSHTTGHGGVRPEAQTMWTVGHCPSCGLHYCRRSGHASADKDRQCGDVRFVDEAGFTPHWTMDLAMISPSIDPSAAHTRTCCRNRGGKAPHHDRSSLCSQSSQSSGTSTGSSTSSSSSSSISEYSVPKNCLEAFYDRPKNIHQPVHPPYNRLSYGEDPHGKADSSLRGRPSAQETAMNCTCWRQRGSDSSQDILLMGGGLLCSCWTRTGRTSMDTDMPSVSSSGSSNASPSTSPKKQLPLVSVPILLPCTCGKSNPYLNYAVPKSGAPVKQQDFKDSANRKHDYIPNIMEKGNEEIQETKIINRIDNSTNSTESSMDVKEDNGNLTSDTEPPLQQPQPQLQQMHQQQQQQQQPRPVPQVCPCQRVLLCPGSLLSSWNQTSSSDDNASQQNHNVTSAITTTEYASIAHKTDACKSTESSSTPTTTGNETENDNLRGCINLNCSCRQSSWLYPVDCCGRGKLAIPVFNASRSLRGKDNANHIYVNLKYLQETMAISASHGGPMANRKLIPYYANLHFIQTLALYENAKILGGRSLHSLHEHPTDDEELDAEEPEKIQSGKKKPPKKKLELPSSNQGVYEMMSFNQGEASLASNDNYLFMQPGVMDVRDDGDTAASERTAHQTATAATSDAPEVQPSGGASANTLSDLPLRPFMPILLPFHEHNCEMKDEVVSDSDPTKGMGGATKCGESESYSRSSRSNSLGDLKLSVFRRGRSSSTDGRHTDDGCSNPQGCCSPKSTPIRKHPLLSKLTFRSKEKSFSTDEITPPSSAPSSPDSMFLESIHKYPFHRSADCLQLNEEYRLSEEDLSQDPEVIMSQSMEKSRVSLSIKRSSSVPCKASAAQQHHSTSSTDSGISTHLQSSNQAAVFSHFIAYHGSLPRRCMTNTGSRHPAVEKKPNVTTAKSHSPTPHQEQKSSSDSSKMILISECKQCHQLVTSPEGLFLLDAKSMTSSTSSDMSDYIETLSLCSRSSTSSGSSSEYIRTEDLCSAFMKIPTSCTSALRPRSGKEYHSFDRVIFQDGCPYIPVTDCANLTLPCLKPFVHDLSQPDGERSSFGHEKPAPVKTNSPSPGYVSSSPGNTDFAPYASPDKSSSQHFLFPKDRKDLNYLEVVSVREQEPTSPGAKSATVQYAVIDVVATAAAQRLGTERAQLREGTALFPTDSHSPIHHPNSTSSLEEKKEECDEK